MAPSRILILAGLAQIVSVFTPAVRVRLVGAVSFIRLPTAGAVLAVLGILAVVLAFTPRGWWRAVPGILTGAILAIAHWKIVHAPSGTFVDPLLRRAAHPAWGFVPFTIAALLGILGGVWSKAGPKAFGSGEEASRE
jgi:hypothetical protein